MRFVHEEHPRPTDAVRRDALLDSPGFGRVFTDHMVTIAWNRDHGWHDARVGPYRPIPLDPAAAVLQYGSTIFEGLKVYRHAGASAATGGDAGASAATGGDAGASAATGVTSSGSLAAFRPEANATRFRASARRMGLPELPEGLFLDAITELLAVDHEWVPAAGGESALYLRPFLVATTPGLVPRAADDHLFVLIAGPAGPYFSRGLAPVRAWMSDAQVRAFPGGTGAAKTGANYAAALAGQADAAAHGCDQVVWLDARHRRYVEEMGVMNLFFVFTDPRRTGSVEVVTPELNGSFLAGITRDSVLTLAADLGARVSERPVEAQEWRDRAADGSLREVFASGTGAVVTPVGAVAGPEGEFTVADGSPGSVTTAVRSALTGIQRGARPDPHGWVRPLL